MRRIVNIASMFCLIVSFFISCLGKQPILKYRNFVKFESFHKNGELKFKGNYYDGMKQGSFEKYNSFGELKKRINFIKSSLSLFPNYLMKQRSFI